MKNVMKGKVATVIILLATFVLAGVAIFTAIRLYQLRQVAVAPNVPVSIPRAQEVVATPAASTCTLAFTLTAVTPTPTPTASGSATPTATPTPTPTHTATPTPTAVPQCNTTCTANTGCPSNLICSIAAGATSGNCRNTSCTSSTNCICATATPHGTAVATPTPAALPQSGTDWPTTLGIGIGILTIIGSLLLAL